MEKDNKLGRTIREVRREKGMTQKDLAEKLNVSTGLIGQYECGIRNPKRENLERIYLALDEDMRIIMAAARTESISPEINEKNMLTSEEERLLSIVRTYNALGVEEIIKRAEELTHIKKYMK